MLRRADPPGDYQLRRARPAAAARARRDRTTTAAYQTLYESSIAFGMRKALQAEQGKADMEARIKQLEAEKKDLERQVQELKAKRRRLRSARASGGRSRRRSTARSAVLKRTNAQLKKERCSPRPRRSK